MAYQISDFDPDRLTALAEARDAALAATRAAEQEANSFAPDLQQHRARLTHLAATYGQREGGEVDAVQSRIDRLETLRRRAADRRDRAQAEWERAGQIFEACLSFAQKVGLPIPDGLVEPVGWQLPGAV